MAKSKEDLAKEAFENWKELLRQAGDAVVAAEIDWLGRQEDPDAIRTLDEAWRKYWAIQMGHEGLDLPEGMTLHMPPWVTVTGS